MFVQIIVHIYLYSNPAYAGNKFIMLNRRDCLLSCGSVSHIILDGF